MNTARKLGLFALALTANLWGLGAQSQTQTAPTTGDPVRDQQEPAAQQAAGQADAEVPPLANQADGLDPENLGSIEQRLEQLEQLQTGKADSALEIGPVAVPFALLTGGGLLVALLGLAAGITAHLQLRRSHQLLQRQSDNLRNRLNALEIQIEQDRVTSRTRPTPSATAQLFAAPPPATNPRPTPIAAPPAAATPAPAAPTPVAQSPAPAAISKAGLIAALNNGDRQQLRDAAKAELNITSESENAIATGRATSTELEEVPGGGSYWLITVNQQHWLFPTDRTLKGFAATQPAKGLFLYEKQTIAEPQLIEPAQLNPHGNQRWVVASMGTIGTP